MRILAEPFRSGVLKYIVQNYFLIILNRLIISVYSYGERPIYGPLYKTVMKNSIHIPEPCHENWDKMSKTDKGRFCLSCTKEVVDFTNMSKGEIVDTIQHSTGSTCGHFHTHQLDQKTVPTGKADFSWKWMRSVAASFLALVAFTFQFGKSAHAQGNKGIRGKMIYTGAAEKTNFEINYATILEGKISMKRFNGPLAGVKVTVLSGEKVIGFGLSDSFGNYKINIPPNSIKSGEVIMTAISMWMEPVHLSDIKIDKEKTVVNISMDGIAIKGLVVFVEPVVTDTIESEGTTEIIEEDVTEIATDSNPEIIPVEGVMLTPTCGFVDGKVKVELGDLGIITEGKVINKDGLTEDESKLNIRTNVMKELVDDHENSVDSITVKSSAISNKKDPDKRGQEPFQENKLNKNALTVFPNPTTRDITVRVKNEGTYNIDVFDNSGRLVRNTSFKGTQKVIDVSMFPVGSYHLRLTNTDDGEMKTLQFIRK